MPDSRSDTALDFYTSPFCKEFLDAAHPVRFAKERITYGSDVYTGFRGHVWPANTLEEIAHGGRLVGGGRIPLARLYEGSRPYGRLLDNMLRPFGKSECKDHFLTTYADDRPVAFTILDFDRHPPRGRSGPPSTEDDGWLSIDEMFWEQVTKFHGITERLDIDVMWVQSPGRWLVDGHDLPTRMFGIYAIIRHGPRTPSELRPMLAAIKGRVGLNVETSWDARHRNIRIPGQCFMDVCRVDPARRSIAPIRDAGVSGERERNMARLAATVEGYGMLRREGGERLLRLGDGRLRIHSKGGTPPEAGEGLVTSSIGDGEPPVVGSTDPGQGITAIRLRQGLVTSPSRKTHAAANRNESGHSRKTHVASDITDTARWLRESDTFQVLHESGLLYRVLREFGWDESRVDEAVEWAAPRLRSLRPASSATCSDDRALAAFIRKHYIWGCRTYDPIKARESARRRARAEDEVRIAPSLRLDDKALGAYLKNVVGLSARDMKHLTAFRRLERAYAGRIACGALYAAFGSQRRFMGFIARHRLLYIVQEHSQSQGRCRQWSLSPSSVRSVRTLMASPVLLFMLCGGEGRVTYIQTQPCGQPPLERISGFGTCRPCGIHPASVLNGLPARGPPPQAMKTRENAMFGMPGSATGTRRHRDKKIAA